MKKAAILALLCASLAPAFARAGTNLGNSLKVWGVIHQGDYLVSPSQKYFATLQGDSNLVVYQGTFATGGPAVWSTGTSGRATQSHAVLQADGNFVLYAGPEGGASGVLWAAASNAGGTSTVTLDDTGALAVCSVDASGAVTSMRWSTGGRNIGSWLPTSSFFRTNDYLVSPGKKFSAVLQPDGNLVIVDGYRGYNGTGAVRWASNSGGHTGPAYASLQPDGNFVIYGGTGPSDSRGSWWSASSTGGNGQSVLVLDDLGTLRVYNGTYTSIGSQRWAGPGDVGLAPTTTVNGLSFVNLRAPSGKWLGSTPDGNLYLTPNS